MATHASPELRTRVVLVKPPEVSRFSFGAFSLGVLAAAIRDVARIDILDATRLSLDKAARAVWKLEPDVVGVTVMSLASIGPAAAFVRRMRADANAKAATVLAGGHGASMMPGPLLAAGADAVVLGEGELTLRAILMEGIHPGMPGVTCLVDGRPVAGPLRPPIKPLDRLQPPARDLMPPPGGTHLMETSRGCPHACAFCEASRFHGRLWRPHSPARVAAEVRRLVEDFNAWVIHFADDNFAASPRRVLEICERLQRGPLPAFFLASARADDLVADPRVIPAMAAAGILRLSVGVETVEPEVAAAVDKPITLDTYREAFARMRAHGMFSVASFIIGLPGETDEMRARAVELAIETGADSAHFLPFLPLPGTPLASGAADGEPAPGDARDAHQFTRAFSRRPAVRARLAEAVAAGGVRGLLAKATLREWRARDMQGESNR